MRTHLSILFLLSACSTFAQSDYQLIKAAIEFEDVHSFLSDHVEGELFLQMDDHFVSLEDKEEVTSLGPHQARLILESVIDDGNKFKLKFVIDDQITGKVTLLPMKGELQMKKAYLKSGEGKSKSKMISFEF